MRMAELNEWMRQLGGEVDLGIARKMGTIAVEITTELFKRTPVDTGRARLGWRVTLDAPSTDEPGRGSSEGDPISMAIGVKLRATSSERPIYIVNNVPYIGILNAGSSRQAPAGFVQASVLTGAARARHVRVL